MGSLNMEITVIDDSDLVGWAAAVTRTGEIYMTDVRSMVANVIGALGRTGRIDRLNILDHGNSSEIEIGSDVVDVSTFPTFESSFRMLRSKFSSSGFVHLQHCNIGSNHTLLTLFARTFGVPVYAGTGAHNPVYRFNWGDYEVCDPAAVCNSDVPRP